MRLHVDKEADALYLRLDDSKIIESEEVAPGVILDYNDKDEVVGVEMLYLSKRTPNLKTTLPTLTRSYPRRFTFYVAHPVRSIAGGTMPFIRRYSIICP